MRKFMSVSSVVLMSIAAHAAVYEIDASHSTIGFSIKHMVVANVKGSFGEFDGTIDFDPANPASLKAAATIQVKSIDTANEKRDAHLLDADFFDAAQHPQIFFETTAIEGTLPNLVLVGNLSMKGVTREIKLAAEVSGPVKDFNGKDRIGISGAGEIDRRDFGITWSKTLDNGGLVVGDTVRLIIEIEAISK